MKLNELYKTKKFIITAEIFPPKGTNTENLLKKAAILKNHIDAVNVTDNQRSCMRLGALGVSKVLLDNGIEPIYQITCRDRNRLALQSDLLTASVLNIKNVLILSGDHPKNGDHPDAKPVYDLDSIQLIQAASGLNNGKDMSGNILDGRTDFCIGAVVNPTVEPIELQMIPMEKKIEAGAKFFQTQVAFDIKPFENLINYLEKNGLRNKVKIIGGMFLLKSLKMIDFMKKIPGVSIPDAVVERISKSDNQLNEGIKICAESIKTIKDILDGVHIMAINSEELIPDILSKI
ncbi:MAG TPA: methylenetetrahydrofolate reductase [bacterium]|nr:methylenetetrahydrofolate reductase [bacterium]HPN30140.1 methylenetetrahydrofolate reductase [bacterium]